MIIIIIEVKLCVGIVFLTFVLFTLVSYIFCKAMLFLAVLTHGIGCKLCVHRNCLYSTKYKINMRHDHEYKYSPQAGYILLTLKKCKKPSMTR